MLSSRLFFSDHAFRKRIKSPVECAVGGALSIYRRYEEKDPHSRPLPHQALVKWTSSMGQVLFAPPNVKGWPGGDWLNTATLLDRDNFAAVLASGELWIPPAETTGFAINPDVPPPRAFDSARDVEEEKASKPEDVVRVLLDTYVPGGVHEGPRETGRVPGRRQADRPRLRQTRPRNRSRDSDNARVSVVLNTSHHKDTKEARRATKKTENSKTELTTERIREAGKEAQRRQEKIGFKITAFSGFLFPRLADLCVSVVRNSSVFFVALRVELCAFVVKSSEGFP